MSGRANVMVYDDVNKKWVPAGSSNGFAKVHIYHHVVNNTYRVVGRKLQDQEVRANWEERQRVWYAALDLAIRSAVLEK